MLTVALLLMNVALLTGLAIVGWRNRTKSSACIFAILQAVSAVWAALSLVGLLLAVGPLRRRVWGLATGLSLLVGVLWLAFILSYTGRTDLLRSRWFLTGSAPLLAGGVLYAVVPSWQPLVGELEQTTIPAGTIVQATIGPVGGLLGVWIYAVFAVGLAVVVATIVRGNELIVGQSVALFLGSLVTIGASLLALAGIPAPGYPLTAVALGGQSLLWGYATFRQEFLRVVPAVGRTGEHAVFDELEDGVLVVDEDGTVMRANPEALAAFDVADLVGRSIVEVVNRPAVSTPTDLRGRLEYGRRTYQVRVSDVTNWRGTAIGKALVIRDATELVRRQQRLQVLNRVLRHNVRNDMNLVGGIGTQLRDAADEEFAEMGATIAEQARSLASISEKALEIERVFDSPTVAESVDVQAVVRSVVDPLADRYPDASVTVDVAVTDVRTDAELFALVVEETVENAVMHAGDAPTVTVRVTRSNDRIEVCVADDGPGVPEMELEPIRSGEETDLQHASGLGIWLIFWGTQSLGGDVDVATTADGSTVTLSLPDVDAFETGTAASAST